MQLVDLDSKTSNPPGLNLKDQFEPSTWIEFVAIIQEWAKMLAF